MVDYFETARGAMKSTIWSKILFFVVIPYLIIFGVCSTFIIRAVFQDKTVQANLEIRNLLRYNEISLKGYLENIRLSVKIAAVELENIDPARPDARKLGENVILASFENKIVYNSWLIFEPDAFDGLDAAHKGEYPGETSGRFMRSFVRSDSGSGYLVAPDMDETSLEDMHASYWYLTPKSTGKLYTDINVDAEIFWDYGIGEGSSNTLSLVSPIFRDGEFIGCVGQDIILNDVVLGPEIIPGAISALFAIDGTLRYSKELSDAGKTLEDLGFANAGELMEVFARNEEFCQSSEYSPLLKAPAFSCFMPVGLGDFGETAYLYAAIPGSMVRNAMYPVLKPIMAALIFALLIFTASFFYLIRSLSKPIHDLTLASEAISKGNFDAEIAMSWSKDEIGIMTRSLHRMVEQFRLYIVMQEQSKELLDIYTRLHRALYRHGRIEDVFDEVIAVICDSFRMYKASLLLVSGKNARFQASYDRSTGLRKENDDFVYHSQVRALLSGKKYITLNTNSMAEQKIDFFDKQTLFLCILPIQVKEDLRGYIIIEGNNETGPLVHSDSALLFISETIAYMLTRNESTPQSPPESAEETLPPTEDSLILKARALKELDVDRGIYLVGGSEDQYGELLRISARVFIDGIQKMQAHYQADIPAFAVEVHGMKGALYTIGAMDLGDNAKALEFAAKAGDGTFCTEAYPSFEEHLGLLAQRLAAITKRQPLVSLGPGSMPELAEALRKALEFTQNFDSAKAAGNVSPLLRYSWDDLEKSLGGSPAITEALEKIVESLENIDYDEAENALSALLKTLEAGDAGA
jgi:HAMP domain-containing protein